MDRLARDYRIYGAQYAIFNDAPRSPTRPSSQFLDTAQAINKIRDPLLRADTAGTCRRWSACGRSSCRQGTIAAGKADADARRASSTAFGQIRSDASCSMPAAPA